MLLVPLRSWMRFGLLLVLLLLPRLVGLCLGRGRSSRLGPVVHNLDNRLGLGLHHFWLL